MVLFEICHNLSYGMSYSFIQISDNDQVLFLIHHHCNIYIDTWRIYLHVDKTNPIYVYIYM